MSSKQLYRKSGKVLRHAVDSAIVVESGDLLYLNTDDARPAASFTYGANLDITQANFAAKFLGVAQEASASGDTADITIQKSGVFEFACASATFEVGDLVGPDDNAGGTALVNQQVIAIGENGHGAIGRVFKRYGAATTRVEVELFEPSFGPSIFIPLYQGLITTGADLVTDWAVPWPFKLIALHSIVTVLCAGVGTISVEKGATALDDTHVMGTTAAVGEVDYTDMTDATGDDLFVAGDTLTIVSDGTPTAGEALFMIEVRPFNMQVA